MAPETLQQEGLVFEAHLDEWRATHLGEYVLIQDREIIGFFPSLAAAFAEGTARFGLSPFFVKQIVPRDVVNVSLFGRRVLSSR